MSCYPSLPSAIFSQFLWFNSNIKIDNNSIFISDFASKNINFVGQIFHKNSKTKSWDYIKSEYNLESKLKFCWIQLTYALPKLWKNSILNCIGNAMNLCIFDHHLIKKRTFTTGTSWEEENYIKYKYLESTKVRRTLQLYYKRYLNKI